MLEHITGDLLQADVEALVNTVNTVGVMGKGIALQFRQAFPANFTAYSAACKRGEVQPGRMFVVEIGALANPRYIINFPTKRHWKGKARLEDIEAGLIDLIEVVRKRNIRSIAVPPLGCGNGGLDWDDIRPRIEAAFTMLPTVQVLLYAPEGTPGPEAMQVNTARPTMTAGRAAVISLIRQYALPGYRVTMLEVEKLAYFLQVAGAELRLPFVKGPYGPYAENLHHVLQRIDGHFIRGYGDRSRGAAIYLMPGADLEAAEFLESDPAMQGFLDRVSQLIEGFETPYGLELLATIHWLAANEASDVASDVEAAVRSVHAWNERKQTFRPAHIQVAWKRLRDQGWLAAAAVASSLS